MSNPFRTIASRFPGNQLSTASLRSPEIHVLLALQDSVKIGGLITLNDVMKIVQELGLSSTENSWTIMESLEREGYFRYVTEEINAHRLYQRLPKIFRRAPN